MTSRGEPALTFFESVTVFAFAIFADEPLDVVVLEVGIGGTWGFHERCRRRVVSVVTPIGLDHTDMLGETPPRSRPKSPASSSSAASWISAAQDPERRTKNDVTLVCKPPEVTVER